MEFYNESNNNETPKTDFLDLEDGDYGDQYYVLEKDTIIYRTDDTKFDGILENIPTFFVYDKYAATSYGELVRSYKVINRLKLLALDKNIKSFYNESPDDIKKILRNQYGYNIESKKPIRDSVSIQDNKLVKYLCDKGYDGYATDLMNLVGKEGGNFHKEIVICKPQENLSEGKLLVEGMTDDNIIAVNAQAKLIKQNKLDQRNRTNKRGSLFNFDNNNKMMPNNLFDDDDENNPNNVNPRRKLFGGKRKSKRKSVKKKRVIKNRKNKRTIKKNNKNKKIKNSKKSVRNRK